MKTVILFEEQRQVYPGEYTPRLNSKKFHEEAHKNTLTSPKVNLLEYDDNYFIEVVAPGFTNEDFLVTIDANVLSICVVHLDDIGKPANCGSTCQERNRCLDHHIILPENADPSFINAEYKAGLLLLRIPKSKKALKVTHANVVVY